MIGRYVDPLDVVWVTTARRLGLTVRRRPDLFASADGRGGLFLGDRRSLDPDDCTGQMILHEICHWIVAGPDAVERIDWGFEPMDGLDWREWPTLRLQRWLCDTHGLSAVFAPTTDARAYWDKLVDPLEGLDNSPEESRILERTAVAVSRSGEPPWQPALGQALAASAAIVTAAATAGAVAIETRSSSGGS